MAMVMRVAGDKEGNGTGGKSNCNGDEGGRQAMVTRAFVPAPTAMGDSSCKKGGGQ